MKSSLYVEETPTDSNEFRLRTSTVVTTKIVNPTRYRTIGAVHFPFILELGRKVWFGLFQNRVMGHPAAIPHEKFLLFDSLKNIIAPCMYRSSLLVLALCITSEKRRRKSFPRIDPYNNSKRPQPQKPRKNRGRPERGPPSNPL